MFTCIICGNTFKGSKTRKYCKVCNEIPRYCACGCGTQLTYPYHDSKFTSGHNVYFESKETIKARGLKGKIASLGTEKTQEFTCKLCGKVSQGTNGRKTCISCQTKVNECACGCGTKIQNSKYHHKIPQYAVGHNMRALTFEEQKRRNAKRLARRSYTEEHAKANSERMKKAYKEGKLDHLLGGGGSSKVELSLKPYLEPLGFIHTLDKKYYIGSRNSRVRIPDYVNPKTKQIVEVFGTYWHRDRILPVGQKHKTPQEVIDWYFKQGWNCTVVWEDEISDFINSLMASNLGGF